MFRRLLAMLFVLTVLMTGCSMRLPAYSSPAPDHAGVPAAELALNKPGKVMSLSIETERSEYPIGVQDITLLWTNRSQAEYVYGEYFALERYEDSNWIPLPMLEGIGFEDIGNLLSPNSTRAQKLALSFAYGELTEGDYRILMQATDNQGDTPETLTAVFRVSAGVSASPVTLPATVFAIADMRSSDVICITRTQTGSKLPDVIWASDADASNMLSYLQSLRLTAYLGGKANSEIGEAEYRYDVYCFDGKRVTLEIKNNALSFGDGFYAFETQQAAVAEHDVYLRIKQPLLPSRTRELPFEIVNSTQDTVSVVMAPMLERATPYGWERIETEGGFCGTPDQVQTGIHASTLPLHVLYPTAGDGVFRISLNASGPDNGLYTLATVFAIGDEYNV